MKFVISTQEFNFIIAKCLNIVAPKVTIPILANFMIEAKNDQLIITATDLTVGIRCFVEAKVFEEGKTTLPARRLAGLVKELTATNVQVATDENNITEIVADSSKFKLHGMNPHEFPSLPDVTEGSRFTIPQSQLKDMFFRTSFAVARDDERYALTGVLLSIEGGKATFIGTDGKRLAKTFIDVPTDPALDGKYIFPLKAVEEMQKSLGEEGEATIYLLRDKIGIETTEVTMITKLLSDAYPDVVKVIPEKPETTVTLHKEELMTLLRQVALFTNEETHSVRFTFVPGELFLNANTMAVGEGKVSMPVNYQGEQFDIAFNPHFFLEILRRCPGKETISVGITDSYNPGIITDQEEFAQNAGDSSPLFVLMPMRLSE